MHTSRNELPSSHSPFHATAAWMSGLRMGKTAFPKIILHAGAAGTIFWGFHSLKQLPVPPETRAQYGGFWQYLTIQGIYLAGLTMVLSLLLDVFPSVNALKIVKRSLLILTLPLNAIISLIYWPLILLLPSVILQKATQLPGDSPSDATLFYLPLEMDLALHAVPATSLALDFFLFERKYSRHATRFLAPLLSLAYTAWYGWWVERCGAKNNGMFPYPFLTDNPFDVRLAIYAGAGLVAPLFLLLLNSLHF
ncbi:hypothetical protein P691DRAFT_801584 [Macrolepiota fuliginosa MF-IS2]|uniref:FAR-17a/AIG1-like protein n=1 Tax=Macrolepiota fuliginosa MF-IS2 TaxID=1400762 RepID=A0A9P5XKT8_9AGAR|nr:hypothetical protein P691DRAFT_801584 [Macrolepiota fuliginosa MF-IS2]